MNKPGLLRAALVAAMPEYATDPDKLRLFVDKGRLVSRLTDDLGYEWRYTVRIEFENCSCSPDAIAVPLLLWLREYQPDRLLDFAREDGALGFAADILDDQTWDIAWAFELSEAVSVVAATDGKYEVTHLPEPKVDDFGDLIAQPPAPLGEIWLGDRLLVKRA